MHTINSTILRIHLNKAIPCKTWVITELLIFSLRRLLMVIGRRRLCTSPLRVRVKLLRTRTLNPWRGMMSLAREAMLRCR
ncbi:hypothetical protein E4T45_07428 [Aureobasidium sp. EXF-8846]|nr:hypothetical protein E4T45_07428 [Aureobasidium sp. EXF-8846]